MCRILAVTSSVPMNAALHLDAFAGLCRASREYQGDGWGCAVWRGGGWDLYRSLRPVWEDTFRPGGQIRVLMAHARSAFRNEGIAVENTMPFVEGERAFAFNGEMHGVRLAVEGATGAHKLCRFLLRQAGSSSEAAVGHGVAVLRRRTARIRACNFLLAEPGAFILHSLFDGEDEYFTMHVRRREGETVIASRPYPGEHTGWTPVPNGSLRSVPWLS